MSDAIRSIRFSVILCVVLSVMLTAASSGLKPYRMKNAEVDRKRNILLSVGLINEGRSYRAREIETLFDEKIRSYHVDAEGYIVSDPVGTRGLLPLYVHESDGKIQDYIVPIDTKGLWGKIHGYLALAADGETVSGFTVYKHSETPGLGGEIERRWFRKNFEGKKIVSEDGSFVSVAVAKGKVAEAVPKDRRENYVDGISGATLTGKFLTSGLKHILSDYESVSIRFRKHKPVLRNQGAE